MFDGAGLSVLIHCRGIGMIVRSLRRGGLFPLFRITAAEDSTQNHKRSMA